MIVYADDIVLFAMSQLLRKVEAFFSPWGMALNAYKCMLLEVAEHYKIATAVTDSIFTVNGMSIRSIGVQDYVKYLGS